MLENRMKKYLMLKFISKLLSLFRTKALFIYPRCNETIVYLVGYGKEKIVLKDLI